METKKAVSSVLMFILRSLLSSVIIFFVGICIMTKSFPPNISKVKDMYSNVRKLKQITHELKQAQANPELADSDAEIDELIEKRKKLGKILNELNILEPETAKVIQDASASHCYGLQGELQNMRIKLNRLEAENVRLSSENVKLKIQLNRN